MLVFSENLIGSVCMYSHIKVGAPCQLKISAACLVGSAQAALYAVRSVSGSTNASQLPLPYYQSVFSGIIHHTL